MRITTARRVSQLFFFLLFLWFCFATVFGVKWWQLRGWPVNLFLELDPLVAIGTLLSTHTLYRGLLWALAVVIVTVLFGRVFCGWLCPFGAMHQFLGYLAQRRKAITKRMELNNYRPWQSLKYYILFAMLLMAALPLGKWVSLQTGLLDPIPLAYRSVNLGLLPLADALGYSTASAARQYPGAWVIGALFLAALFMNFVIPRFYCRFICPLGALLGILSANSVWRIANKGAGCTQCDLCEKACEGACQPGRKIRVSECVMCCNCLDGVCRRDLMTYQTRESAHGEIAAPDLTRRGVVVAFASGMLAVPMLRVGGSLASNWDHRLVRPPGSLPEPEFLERCIKCGQCMRICPTNVIVPAGLDFGIENLWTPVLNFRNGTSGCQLNCTACGHICPVAAIRPLSLAEKLGVNEFGDAGPIRIGTAFVDRGRCLPWAMDTPCIVCQENCPVTPKAISIKEFYNPVRFGSMQISKIEERKLHIEGERSMKSGQYSTGDFFAAAMTDGQAVRQRVSGNSENVLELSEQPRFNQGDRIEVQVRLQAPCVDIRQCIGCGVCEHECPVSGLRAIRVTAENETRNSRNSLTAS